MSDELHQIILADTASSMAEEPPRRRGFFGRKRRSRLPEQPLTHCENCGEELRGRYCYKCGQAAVNYHRSFRHVIVDVLDSFLNWDSKFIQSLGLLLWNPALLEFVLSAKDAVHRQLAAAKIRLIIVPRLRAAETACHPKAGEARRGTSHRLKC